MKKLHIQCLNHLINFNTSFKRLKIRSNNDYKFISFNILNQITLSNDNQIIDNKNILVLYNPYEINLNDKKLLNGLYSELKINLSDEQKLLIQNIEVQSFKLFDELLYDSTYPFEYNTELDIFKFFSAFNISFKNLESSDYLELLINYFKLESKFCKIKFIISFGLSALLSEEEIKLLEKELAYNDLAILDIIHDFSFNLEKNDLTIEEDWCII